MFEGQVGEEDRS